ncbi:hypothetical protein [Kordia sp.]|uniref:hypothetical protein n=1 Tax=Kordia sp. TaxID=1965332 RepID=UPI003D283B74
MENVSHCNFCEHKEFDFATGNICGLTQKKADFIKKCPKISFDVNAKEKIAQINQEYKAIKDRKVDVIGHLVLYSIIGVALIIIDIYFTQYLFEAGWISTASIVGIAVGLSLIGYGFAPLVNYREASGAAKSQKDRLDAILKTYDYGYDINFEDENYLTAVTLRRVK